MKKEQLTIEVSEQVYDLAASGSLNVITAHLDPSADKDIQEGLKPTEVSLKARGVKKPVLTYKVIGSDVVSKGYKVTNKKNKLVETMTRNTGRLVIGHQISTKASKEDEVVPSKS